MHLQFPFEHDGYLTGPYTTTTFRQVNDGAWQRVRQRLNAARPYWRTALYALKMLGHLLGLATLELAEWAQAVMAVVGHIGLTTSQRMWQSWRASPVWPRMRRWWRTNGDQVWTVLVGCAVTLALVLVAGLAQTSQAMGLVTEAPLAEGSNALRLAGLQPGATPTLRPSLLLSHEPASDWVAPAPTLTPMPTATPLMLDYREWVSVVPPEGGWDGAGACPGAVWSPVGTQAWHWPTDMRFLSGRNYGYYHPGLDFAADYGSPIYASDIGVVVYAGWNYYGYGNLLIVDHGNGWHTLYAHLDQLGANCGQVVAAGQIIGLAGSTGNSTGPHLHFEMRGPTGRVNPWHYLP